MIEDLQFHLSNILLSIHILKAQASFVLFLPLFFLINLLFLVIDAPYSLINQLINRNHFYISQFLYSITTSLHP